MIIRHDNWSCVALAFLLAAAPAGGARAQTAAVPVAMSFEAAVRRLETTSPALSGASHAERAARETAAAVATLRRPLVTASAQYLEFQKTLSVDLTGAKQSALGDTQDFLSGLPGTLPPAFQDIATDVTNRLSQALPGLFSAIPDSLSYRYRDDVFRPTVQAIVPLYTGGAIPAIQRGARAGIDAARARTGQARDAARINLIRAYFGQGTAAALARSALESRDALDRLLSDARKLEAAGVIARARVLEAQVARDTAERGYQRAALAQSTARDDLARLLEVDAVDPTTPLFVASRPLPPARTFLGREADIAQVRQADAAGQIARAGVDLAKSRYRPQAFGFGEYNLNRGNALPTEPDWVVGAGIRYTLLSNVDRGHTLNAARETAAAADDAAREARKAATGASLKAWDLVEGARRSFLLLDSSLAAARENLRVQQVSFREGEGTLTAVLGAEAALASARAERAAIAYEYDLALAGLLASTGQLDAFADHLAAADIKIETGARP
ncbi:TolC family protein [Sphingomonas hylomeconis]|uniref:TolC family protein n=1 Tax=Sphingomonas hylomeconis TaxID=1395958 RepID=A0ABV7SY79_9SPHN|nr:TolC family protein [Sphingomonas hylomeconis]